MKRVATITLKTAAVLSGLFIISLLVADRFIQFRMDDQEFSHFFSQKGLSPSLSYYKKFDREIRYASIGRDTSATLFYIHGAPSSLSYYRDYMSDSLLLQKASMFAMDRAGYGFSGLGHPEISIEKQVQLITPILDSLNKVHHPVVVVAASYGTSIACRLAMDRPDLVDGLVLLAPSLAPGQEKVYWFSHLIESPLLNWFIPRMLKTANAEKIHHQEELAKMLPYWSNINVPVIYMQGDNDKLIYTSNADFAKEQLINVPHLDIKMIPNRGHLIAFSEKEAIKNKIVEMIDLAKMNKEGTLSAVHSTSLPGNYDIR
ncbi:MAG: alpha/beta hydrolase [Chitinophagaceae bacterium]|nr:alpha/beta hydrolase [Chitinophagaceae bacterium]MCW5926562.1 alpha/beta hydrolase [Chitinophagaceae bacterium]